MHDKTIVFLDDSDIFYSILTDGYFKSHALKEIANLKAYKSTVKFFNDINNDLVMDYLVIDYHMPGADGATINSVIKHKQPDCKMWLYTGMPGRHIKQSERNMFRRIINKDVGVSYLLDALYVDISSG